MEGLAIATFPVEAAVVSGESLPFLTVLENLCEHTLQVPGRNSPSQFTYELRPRWEGSRAYLVCAELRNSRRATAGLEPAPVVCDHLAPWDRAERVEDLADLLNEGIEPGDYFVTVQVTEANLVSPRCLVKVLPAKVENWSSAVSGNSLTTALAHRQEDGGIAILQRESLKDPRESVFYRRQTLPAGTAVEVATTIDLAPAGNGRWLAWLRDGALTASMGWANRTVVTAPPIGVEAAQSQLLSPGFQVAPGTALFGILDRNGDAVQLMVYLAECSGLTHYWTAEVTAGGAGNAQWSCQPDGSVTVVWQEPATGRLLSRDFRPDGSPAEASPRVRTSSRLAAWLVAPTGPLAISMLGSFGGSYRYARLGAESMADPNPIPELPGATCWGFLPGAGGVTIVAATAMGIAQIKPGGEWQVVVETNHAQALHAFAAADGSPWVEWVSPGYGIRRTQLLE